MSSPVFWKSSSATSFTSSASEYETAAGVLDILAVRVSETAGDADGPLRYLLRKDYNFIYEAFPGSATGADTGVALTAGRFQLPATSVYYISLDTGLV